MAYRQAPSPRSLSNTMYVPENDPNRAAAQQEVIDAYNAQFGAKAQWDRNYQFVLQNTGDPEKARIYADSIASTQNRQELTQLATGVAGPAASFGREAIATAKALRAAPTIAEEAPGAMRLLAGPSRRNAQTAEEMLTPDVIPMGGPSFNTPRLTYAKPETRYRMALDRTAQPRPLANYERPAIDTTFVRPEDVRPFSAGEVRTPVDPIAALNTETTVPVSNAPKWADVRLKEAQRAEEMMNEGGVWPTQQRTLRRLAGESEDAFRARQLAIMEEEGGGAGRQATLNNLDRQAEADFRARQIRALDDEAGAITSGRNPPNRVARALQLTERQPPAAPPEFVGPPEMQGPRQITPGNFIGPAERQGPPEFIGPRQTPQIPLLEQLQSGQISGREYQAALNAQRSQQVTPNTFIGPAERQGPPELIGPRQMPQPGQPGFVGPVRPAPQIGDPNFIGPVQNPYVNPQGSLLPSSYIPGGNPGAAAAGATALAAAALATGNRSGENQSSGAVPAGAGMQIPSNYVGSADFTLPRRQIPVSDYDSIGSSAPQQAIQRARALATPTPMMRPESSPSPKDSILSRIFSGQDYQSSGPTRGDNRLYQGEKDGRKVINWGDSESAADFFRASKAQQDWNAQNPDSPSIGAGMKRGGAAKPGKDEAVHKALDIIQHLLMRH